MIVAPVRGATYLIEDTGPAHDPSRAHLHIVLAYTTVTEVAAVPICSVVSRCDRTCLLGPGDHRFLKHPSYVAYADTARYSVKTIQDRVKDGSIRYLGVMDGRVFALVVGRALESPFLPGWAELLLSPK
jgi:hypothetical protein